MINVCIQHQLVDVIAMTSQQDRSVCWYCEGKALALMRSIQQIMPALSSEAKYFVVSRQQYRALSWFAVIRIDNRKAVSNCNYTLYLLCAT